MAKKKLSDKYQVWIDARKRFHLSHAHIQMARELGLNPKKFGGLANHQQELWKAPLHIFIENIYYKRFGKSRPDNVRSIEEIAHDKKQKKAESKAQKLQAKNKPDCPQEEEVETAPAALHEDRIVCKPKEVTVMPPEALCDESPEHNTLVLEWDDVLDEDLPF